MLLSMGCAALPPNSFLDPSKVGRFPLSYGENEVRRVLTPLESPIGLANAVEPLPEDLAPDTEDYRIGGQDILQVAIDDFMPYGAYSSQLEVTPAGFINLPQLGLVRVIGMTEREVEADLRKRTVEAGLLTDPIVQVFVQLRRRMYYSIIGAVRQPGTYPISQQEMRVLDAIGLAGDIGPSVKSVYVIRRDDPMGGYAAPPGEPSAAPTEAESAPAPRKDLVIPPPDDGFDDSFFARMGVGRPNEPETRQDAGGGDVQELDQVVSPAGRPADSEPGLEAGGGSRPFAPLILDPQTGQLVEMRPQPDEPADDRSRPAEPPPGKNDFNWEDVPEFEINQRVIEIDVNALKSGDPRYNIVLRSRDVINVPVDTGIYYMMGEVNRPGVYSFGDRDITLKQAVATVGGLGPLAWPQRCEVIRQEKGTDKQITIPVNLDAIFAGLEPDLYLRDNDIVNVGTSTLAPFLFVIRNSFRFTYGFGFVYDRNYADVDAYSSRVNPDTLKQARRQTQGLPF